MILIPSSTLNRYYRVDGGVTEWYQSRGFDTGPMELKPRSWYSIPRE